MKSRDTVLVGVVLIVAFLAVAVGTIYLARGSLQSGYPLFVRLPWGAGIRQGSAVFLSGVDVGYVGDVDLRQDGTLIVTMRIEKQYHVPDGTTAAVEPNGIFGDVDIALRPLHPSPSFIAPGDTVPAGKAAPGVAQLLARADSASGKLEDVARTVQIELVQGGGIADIRKTLEAADQLVTQLSQIAGQQSQQLAEVTRSLRRTANAIDSAAVDSAVQNLKTTTSNMSALSDNLEHATDHLDAILVKVDSGNGTMGKMLNDPGLYNQLQKTLANIDSLAADLRKHPSHYVNVHVF